MDIKMPSVILNLINGDIDGERGLGGLEIWRHGEGYKCNMEVQFRRPDPSVGAPYTLCCYAIEGDKQATIQAALNNLSIKITEDIEEEPVLGLSKATA